jgi:hypothetical protein
MSYGDGGFWFTQPAGPSNYGDGGFWFTQPVGPSNYSGYGCAASPTASFHMRRLGRSMPTYGANASTPTEVPKNSKAWKAIVAEIGDPPSWLSGDIISNSGATTYRDVAGKGGYTYRQYVDGAIYIVQAPTKPSVTTVVSTVTEKVLASADKKDGIITYVAIGAVALVGAGGIYYFWRHRQSRDSVERRLGFK